MKKRSAKFSWMRLWRCTALATAWVGIVFFISWMLFVAITPAKSGRFSVDSLPRFEVSTARVSAGRSITILLDKRTIREYLLVETPTGAALTPLPWKDECDAH